MRERLIKKLILADRSFEQRGLKGYWEHIADYILADGKIVEAVEKQIPEKPETSYDGYADGNPVWDYFCPCCHRNFEDKTTKFCDSCGQAIDWSDDK